LANPTPQFSDAASNGGATQASNLGHTQNTTMATPHGQESGKQAPLPFIEHGQDAVDRLMICSDGTLRLSVACRAAALINGPLPFNVEVNHDLISSSLKRIRSISNLDSFGPSEKDQVVFERPLRLPSGENLLQN
jgi:hypothetical protein